MPETRKTRKPSRTAIKVHALEKQLNTEEKIVAGSTLLYSGVLLQVLAMMGQPLTPEQLEMAKRLLKAMTLKVEKMLENYGRENEDPELRH